MTNSDDSDRDIAQRKAQLERRAADKAPASGQTDLIGAQPPPGGFKPVYLVIAAAVLALVLGAALLLLQPGKPKGAPVAPVAASAAPTVETPSAAPSSSPAPSVGDAVDASGSPTVAPEGAAPVSTAPAVALPTPGSRPRRRNVGHDAYVCAHGDQGDIRTIEACDRKDAAIGRGGG